MTTKPLLALVQIIIDQRVFVPCCSSFCPTMQSKHFHVRTVVNNFKQKAVAALHPPLIHKISVYESLSPTQGLCAVSKLEWHSPLKVILYPDPRLRAKNARIGSFDDTLRQFAEELLAVMYSA